MRVFREFFERIKKNLIVFIIMWVILAILAVPAITYGRIEGTKDGTLNITTFVLKFAEFYADFFNKLGEVFKEGNLSIYLNTLLWTTIVFLVSMIIIRLVSKKDDYYGIEHGSGDWAAGGEGYSILSSKKGIILAEKYFLPIDKRGNINVLIVGRFWIW